MGRAALDSCRHFPWAVLLCVRDLEAHSGSEPAKQTMKSKNFGRSILKLGRFSQGDILHLWHAGTIFVSFLILYLFVPLIFRSVYRWEIFLGWVLALGNHLANMFIEKKSLGSETLVFLKRTIGLKAVKAILFLGGIFFILAQGDLAVNPFIFSLFAAYFIFLSFEILNTHFRSGEFLSKSS